MKLSKHIQDRISALMWITITTISISVLLEGFWFFEVVENLGQQARQESLQLLHLEELLGQASDELHVQVRNWKNSLLRSDDPDEMARNKADFHVHAAGVQKSLENARIQALALGMDEQPIVLLQLQHQASLDNYALAWKVVEGGKPATYKLADDMTVGMYRSFSRSLNLLHAEYDRRIQDRVANIGHIKGSSLLASRFVELGALAILLPLMALVSFLISYRVIRQLARADRRIHAIFEAIGDAVVVVDDRGRVTSLNSRALQLMGYTQEQAIGHHLKEVLVVQDTQSGETMECSVATVLRYKQAVPKSTSLHLLRPDGQRLVIEDSAAPVFDVRGNMFGAVMVFQDVTDRYSVQSELSRERELFEKTFNMAAVGMAHLAPSGQWTRVNNKLCHITGYSADELKQLSFQGVTHPDDLGDDLTQIKRLLNKEIDILRTEKRYVRKDGRIVWVAINVGVVWKDDGSPDFGVSVIEDIHSRKLAEQEARLAHEQYAALFEQMPEGVILFTTDLKVMAHNREAMHQLGYTSEQMQKLHVGDIEAQDDAAQIETRKRKIVATGRDDFESKYRKSNGSVFDVDVSVQLVQLPGDVRLFQTLFRDITDQKQSALQIERMAYHDQLTGLANRRLLHDRMTQAISSTLRRTSQLAVLYLDLDHFKLVNDSMGHSVGDEMLLQVAKRLQAGVRTEDTVARMGGDEFVVLLGDIQNADDAALMANKLIVALSEPMLIHGEEMRITPSLGISLCPHNGRDADELLKYADAALYQAKQMGRATYRFYTQSLNDDAVERLKIERLLHKALAQSEFELYYQPQVSLSNGQIVGCEALIRWNQPTMGLVPPVRFIPIAEHSHLINQIGHWVMHRACQQAKIWHDQGHHLKVSFNVSARQFMRPVELLDDLRSALNCGVPPHYMGIEITESMLMDFNSMGNVFRDIRALGCQIVLDDFGTGYSSLSYLRRFPIEVLKIDRSFVSHSDKNPKDLEMVRTIVGMAHNLNMKLVAEGVETEEQSTLLSGMHCEVAQGYLYSKPLPLEAFEALLADQISGRCSQFQVYFGDPQSSFGDSI